MAATRARSEAMSPMILSRSTGVATAPPSGNSSGRGLSGELRAPPSPVKFDRCTLGGSTVASPPALDAGAVAPLEGAYGSSSAFGFSSPVSGRASLVVLVVAGFGLGLFAGRAQIGRAHV